MAKCKENLKLFKAGLKWYLFILIGLPAVMFLGFLFEIKSNPDIEEQQAVEQYLRDYDLFNAGNSLIMAA